MRFVAIWIAIILLALWNFLEHERASKDHFAIFVLCFDHEALSTCKHYPNPGEEW